MRRQYGIAIVMAVVLGASTVQAAGVAPKKPSDLRTVRATTSSTPCIIDGYHEVTELQKPDGTTGTFSLPPKTVFVITSFEWFATGTAGHLLQASLIVPSSDSSAAIVAAALGVAGSDGSAGGTAQVPSGTTVKAGHPLCFSAGANGVVLVHGFVTKDN